MVVQWDSGSRTNYRVGYQGKYDLRIFDNAPIGKFIILEIVDLTSIFIVVNRCEASECYLRYL